MQVRTMPVNDCFSAAKGALKVSRSYKQGGKYLY